MGRINEWEGYVNGRDEMERMHTCSLSANTCSISFDHRAINPSSLSTISGLLAKNNTKITNTKVNTKGIAILFWFFTSNL